MDSWAIPKPGLGIVPRPTTGIHSEAKILIMADEEQVPGAEVPPAAASAEPTDQPADQAEANKPEDAPASEEPKPDAVAQEAPSTDPPAIDPVAIAAELARARAAALAAQFTAGHTGGDGAGEKRKYEFDPEEEFNQAKRLSSEVI